MASPIKFAHMVLRTNQYETMLEWWMNALEATVRHGNDFITFISYDEEHHRLAIISNPNLTEATETTVGVEHVAFTMASIDDLLDKYTRLASAGVRPYWTINHGMTLSAYYRDPDGNKVEFQIDTMSLSDADEFMRSPVFAANPIGVPADFDELVERRAAGESMESLTQYVPAPMPSR